MLIAGSVISILRQHYPLVRRERMPDLLHFLADVITPIVNPTGMVPLRVVYVFLLVVTAVHS